MRFSVGYQLDRAWVDAIVARADRLDEVYFAFGAMPSGRGAVADVDGQLEDLGRLADAGLGLNLLFNANCYGARALAKGFFAEVGETVERFAADGALLAPLLADAKAGFDLMVMVGAGTGAVFLLRWFWMRINAWTEIVALGVSIVCAVFLQMVGPHVFALSLAFWQRLLLTIGVTTAAWLAATFLTAPEPPAVIADFRGRVRASGRDVGLGVLWTFLVSVAIFAFMWAVGALLKG